MTNHDINNIAMQQSAYESNCRIEDFRKTENVIAISDKNPNARKYLELPFYCDLTSYGNNIVASVSEELKEVVLAYITKYPIEHCFETPNLHILNENLKPYSLGVCWMAEYFLPDMDSLKPLPCEYETRVMGPEQFSDCYISEWSNALCERRKQLDMLAVGAYDHGKLIGLAGCSADCDTMWQIGVDVLTEYRRHGIASSLTSKLAIEVLNRGKVPFYCCVWSNIKSVRNAFKSGLRPAWIQLTVKKLDYIADMNK
jgi:ribosomal protein S18 acetylase RimI-like enzyme